MLKTKKPGCSVIGGAVVTATVAIIVVLYQAIFGSGPLLTVADPTEAAPAAGRLQVYFSDPAAPSTGTLRGGPDAFLAEAIDRARLSVDLAAYDLNLWSVRDALIAAHRRGVAVRVAAESDNLDEREFQDLLQAGIPVLGDRREGLMHHKFVIIDRQEVWTGSMNFTTNGAYRNNNNLLRVRSSRLAESYLVEFEEMFVHDRFGDDSVADTPHPALQVDGIPLEVYFSPDDGVAARLVDLIRSAETSVHFLAFSFTSDDIAQALVDQSHRGVTVAGVFEADQVESNRGTEYPRLRGAGLDVHLDGNPRFMHHKVFIIDGEIVVLGSYNFSASAERRNDENILIIQDAGLAQAYMQEFDRIYAMSQP